jgi:hypothetical protein
LPNLPLDVYLLEALAAAKVARRHWRSDPKRGLPGLNEMEPEISPAVVREILDLVRELSAPHDDVFPLV